MPSPNLAASVRRLLLGASVLALMLLSGVTAHATPSPIGATPRVGPNTDLVMTGTGPGQALTGSIGPAGGDFDPTEGYPDTIPPWLHAT